MMNAQVLERISSGDFQTELGMFNLEVNVAPHRLAGHVFSQLSEELRTGLAYAHRKAGELGAGIVMIGILPTLTQRDVDLVNLSDVDRYTLLNEQVVAARGEDFTLEIEGWSGSAAPRPPSPRRPPAPPCNCTSRSPRRASPTCGTRRRRSPRCRSRSAPTRRSSSAASCGARPGRRCSSRPRTPAHPSCRPRVRPRTWFGERWVDSAYDLFEENLRYFPALLPLCGDEDPLRVVDTGGVPSLRELVLHNGTVYRWNRPVYGVVDGVPHLRVENRVLPAGPTVDDVVANAAFYYGLVRALAEDPGRCGGGCPSRTPPTTSTPPAGTASTPNCAGPAPGAAVWPPCPR